MRGASWRGGARRYAGPEDGSRYRPYQPPNGCMNSRPGQSSHQYSEQLNYGDWTDFAQEVRGSAIYIPPSADYRNNPEAQFRGPVFRGIEAGPNFPYGEQRFTRPPLLPTPDASFDSSWRRRNQFQWDAHRTTSPNRGLSRFNPRIRSPSLPLGPSEDQVRDGKGGIDVSIINMLYEEISRSPSLEPTMAEQASEEKEKSGDQDLKSGNPQFSPLVPSVSQISNSEAINVESIPLPGENREKAYDNTMNNQEVHLDCPELVSPSLKQMEKLMIVSQYEEALGGPSQEPTIVEQATQDHERTSDQDVSSEQSMENNAVTVGGNGKEGQEIINPKKNEDECETSESPKSREPSESTSATPVLEIHASESPSIESSLDTLPEWSPPSIDPFEDSDGTGWCFGVADNYGEEIASSSDETLEWQYSPYPGMTSEMEFTD
ncbi:hypothetical protein L3Y34_002287 [Caenorhabditis briggsae]|uniref:Uncharacterized protein n=1 Tax=Caenorhabditis briggsae TaxID=6238 RepID=A0AAE9IRG3_CAEBR|nr:hypothetical protein L3Y34_002287 [Caenorhabditis briggsae]